MKKTRFISCLMAIILVFGLLTSTATAADIHLNVGPANVYMDNVKVNGITAYMDGEEHVRVESESDMHKIFSSEFSNGGISLSPVTGLIVTDWADFFGYGWSQSENTLYIYRNGSFVPADPNKKAPAEVFVNGLRINDAGVHTYGGEFFIETSTALRTIFPNETKNNLPTVTGTTSLKTYATKYKYTMVANSERVYLYNNGHAPLEVTLNGTYVSFPDQQPYVVSNRTMVPIRTLAETLGFTVEWVQSNNGIKLTKGNTVMWVWVGSTTYYINNVKYNMDVKPFITNNERTMVPIRFIGEAFGYDVKWDGTGAVPVVKLTSK